MSSSFQGIFDHAGVLVPAAEKHKAAYREIYKQHCHRIYSLAFYMTDNELVAEQLAANTFLRAFSGVVRPGQKQIDQAFLAEVREMMPIGVLALNAALTAAGSVRGRLKRDLLGRAVVQLPPTERLIFLLHAVDGYSHEKISHLLGVSEQESRFGLHQARLHVRELVSRMS
jgi:RNA polymerase sigma-70 factor (ECF subfamily)